MMKKKIIGVIGLVFLIFGGVIFGENIEYCKDDYECMPFEVCDAGICIKEENSIRNNKSTPEVAPAVCRKMYFDKELKEDVCCEGVLLNTDVPFIGRCINLLKKGDDKIPAGTIVTEDNAFPRLMGGLMKILVTIIILAGFVGILAGGVMISASGGSDESAGKGKKLIGNIVIAIAILGASGIILRLINPNFFQ